MTEPQTEEAIKQLATTLFAIKGLSHDLAKEREVMSNCAGQIAFSSQQFQKHGDTFAEYMERFEALVKESIAREIQLLGQALSQEMSKVLVEQSITQLDKSLQKVRQSSEECEKRLRDGSSRLAFLSKGVLGFSLISALIGGLLGAGIMHYVTSFDRELIRDQIELGQRFKQLWPQLEQKDRERIKALIK